MVVRFLIFFKLRNFVTKVRSNEIENVPKAMTELNKE